MLTNFTEMIIKINMRNSKFSVIDKILLLSWVIKTLYFLHDYVMFSKYNNFLRKILFNFNEESQNVNSNKFDNML